MLAFDSLPEKKPNQSNITDGRYAASIFDAKMMESKTTPGTTYLNVSFKTASGFVNENYFDSDKPFLQYKLARLLKACKVKLEGNGTLDDVRRVVKGKEVVIDVVVNDRGYGSLDYSGDHEGIYSPDEVSVPVSEANALEESVQSVTIDAEVNEALQEDPFNVADNDF